MNLNFRTIDKTIEKRLKLSSLFSVIIILLLINAPAYAQPGTQTENVSPDGTKFLLYTPTDYVPTGTPFPLLVVLHGGSEIGDDLNELTSLTSHQIPSRLIFTNQWPSELPFIVLTPQLKIDPNVPNPNNQEWPVSYVDAIIEYVKSVYNVDDNRIYLTGISLGGAGAWTYTAAHPEKVAALLPISAKTDITQACAVKDIPIWAFHGENDNLPNTQFTIDMVNAIRDCQPPGAFWPQMNILFSRRHEGWNEVYNRTHLYDVYDWLLKFTKGSTANVFPFVQAGSDKKILVQSTSIHLPAEYFDSDGTISNVEWSQISGTPLTLENTNSKALKVINPVAGMYEFELRVTDNDGAQSTDNVELEVFDALPPSVPAVTGLMLTNGNEVDIELLSEGYSINTTVLASNQINIRAVFSGSLRSIRFSINSDQNTRTPNNTNYLLQVPQSNWTAQPGTYTICATPFSGTNGSGTQGISQCYTVRITDEVPTGGNFYSKAGTDISLLSSWGSNVDGGGAAPVSFSSENQTFTVRNTVSVDNSLQISGAGSSLWFEEGATVNINNSITSPVNTQGNVTLNVNTTNPITFAEWSENTSAYFGEEASTIPGTTYKNLRIGGAGSTKTLSNNTTVVNGNLIIEDNVILNGTSNASTLSVSGTITIQEKEVFQSETGFILELEANAQQNVNIQGTKAVFKQIIVSGGTQANINGPTSGTEIHLGSTSAQSGLIIDDNAKLQLNNAALKIIEGGCINNENQKGRLALPDGTLTFQSTSTQNSNLYPAEGFDSLKHLSVDLGGIGQLILQDTLFLTDSVKLFNGTVQSNGYLTLVSTAEKTARIAEVEGNGNIAGDVQFQRSITPGRMYKYVSFPVSGATVADLQKYIPVTGKFPGSSTGPGMLSNPSLFYYDDPEDAVTDVQEGWIPFPKTNTDENLILGRGYSLFIREEDQLIKYNLKGEVHTGDFPYALDGNVTEHPDRGWNLIGNPYASPVVWGSANGWTTEGVSNTAYIRDNAYGNGRFLVWDGADGDGDEEFEGGVIAQGQSIWIRATNNAPSLMIHEQAKANVEDATLYRTKDEEQRFNKLIVTLSNGSLIDRTYLKFKSGSSDVFEQHRDAVKKKNAYFNIASLSSDSVSLAINNTNDQVCMKEISLMMSETKKGTYTLDFRGSIFQELGDNILLVDNFLDSATILKDQGVYAFTVTQDPRSSGVRFKLKFTNGLPEPVITSQDNLLVSNYGEGNQWLFNGEEIEGANASTFQPSATGDYQVKVTSQSCTGLSAAFTYTVTGTLNPAATSELEVYPNPASDHIYIRGSSANTVVLPHYTILNATGQIVQEGSLETENSDNGVWRLPAHLPSGVYLLQLKDNKKQQQVKFVVK